jgi:hypothetical protein
MRKPRNTYPRAALLTSAWSLLYACDRGIENPTAPDAGGLDGRYENPQGKLSGNNIAEVLADFKDRIDVVNATGQLAVINEVLDRADEHDIVDEQGELDQDPNPKRLVTASLTYTCRGPSKFTDIVDAERYGTMTMQLKLSQHGLYPVVWGTFDHCIESAEGAPFTVGGDYFAVLSDAPRGGLDTLYSFTGAVHAGTVEFDGELDFRVLATGAAEVRVPTDMGDVIIGVDKRARIIARDVAGEWLCNVVTLRCINMANNQVVEP